MTKTDARLDLSQRQRRFEWQLARDEQTRAAARFVAGKTHDLMNLIQIVQLATLELEKRSDPAAREFLDDLQKAAADAQRSMAELMALARPDEVPPTPGAPGGAAVANAITALRTAVSVDIHLATPPDTTTRCTAAELEHILIGIALDGADDPEPIDLYVRERAIDGKPWIEIVRLHPLGRPLRAARRRGDPTRAGGDLATSDRRGGGQEFVVALPVIR